MATALRGRAPLVPLPACTVSKSCKICAVILVRETPSKNRIFLRKVGLELCERAGKWVLFEMPLLDGACQKTRPRRCARPWDWSGTLAPLHCMCRRITALSRIRARQPPRSVVQMCDVVSPSLLRACEIAFSAHHLLVGPESAIVESCGFTRQVVVQSPKLVEMVLAGADPFSKFEISWRPNLGGLECVARISGWCAERLQDVDFRRGREGF